MKIERNCKTCFHRTNKMCKGYSKHKCSLYEIDYDYFNNLYIMAIEQAPGELKQALKEQAISVFDFIETVL